MMNCEDAALLLPEYVGKSTTKQQDAKLALHLSVCKECRSDLAFWLSMKRASKAESLPNFSAMFDKLPRKETTLRKILASRSPGMTMDLVRYTFSVVNNTYKLAGLAQTN